MGRRKVTEELIRGIAMDYGRGKYADDFVDEYDVKKSSVVATACRLRKLGTKIPRIHRPRGWFVDAVAEQLKKERPDLFE